MKIKIWNPDNENEEDADELDFDYELDDPDLGWRLANEVEDVAEKERDCEWTEGARTYHVRLGKELKVFAVEIEWSPMFSASEVKRP
jgi:hypothetical protein